MKHRDLLIANNIYPLSAENVDALVKFYISSDDIDQIRRLDFNYITSTGLTLKELEFIIQKIAENISHFKTNLQFNGMTVSNLVQYGVDAYQGSVNIGSPNRIRITTEFGKLAFSDISS